MAESIEAIVYSTPQTHSLPPVVPEDCEYLASVHRLPEDILLCIFQHLTGWLSNEDNGQDMDYDQELFTVSYVCKRWRASALAYPHLWTQISFLPRFVSTSETRIDCKRVALQLERSLSLPLRVIILINLRWASDGQENGVPTRDELLVKETVRTLFHNIQRCQRLKFCGHLPEDWSIFPEDTECAQLESLISLVPRWFERGFPYTTPTLKHLFLCGAELSIQPLIDTWKNLRTLRLQHCDVTLAALLEVLAVASQTLVSLDVIGKITASDGAQPAVGLAMQSLRTMKLQVYPLGSVLSHFIRAPALRELRLSWINDAANQQLEVENILAIQAFVRATGVGVSLKELWLRTVQSTTGEALISLLSDLSALSTLSVGLRAYSHGNRMPFPHKLLLALHWPDTSPGASTTTGPSTEVTSEEANLLDMKICPSLTDLEIRGAEQHPGLLVDMVRSRVAGQDRSESKEGPLSSLEWLGLWCKRSALREPELHWLATAVQDRLILLDNDYTAASGDRRRIVH